MHIKRKDLERIVEALRSELQDHSAESLAAGWEAIVLGNRLLRVRPDPVDVVPVLDYPFPWRDHPVCPKARTST